MTVMQSFDRAAEDLGNSIHLEHVNVAIPDQRIASLFYGAGLGLGCTLGAFYSAIPSLALNGWVYEQARELLAAGKIVGLVGGDHSTPFGMIRAHAEHVAHPIAGKKREVGILHFDAHADASIDGYGSLHSHGSPMRPDLRLSPIPSSRRARGSVRSETMSPITATGVKVKVIPTEEFFPHMAQGIAVSDQVIKEKPQMVQKFVSAALRGMKDIMDDPDKAADEFVQFVPEWKGKEGGVKFASQMYAKSVYPGQSKLGEVNADRLAKLQDFYLEKGFIQKKTPDRKSVV